MSVIQEERRARSQARLQAIRGRQRDIAESLNKLEQEITAWETKTAELLKGNDGKRIAASKTRIKQFAVVIEKQPTTTPQVQALRERMESLIKPIDRAIIDENTTYFPSDSILNDLEAVGEEARSKLRDLRERNLIVDALNIDSIGATPTEKSLQTLIEEQRSKQLRDRVELIAKTKQEAFDRETRRLADAEAKAEEDLANARLVLLKDKTDAAKAKIEQDAAAEKLQASLRAEEQKRLLAKKKLDARFDEAYPKIKDYLVPFTSPGFKQFHGNQLTAAPDKGPMSLSNLRPLLKKEVPVMENLMLNLTNSNDRPLGAFPVYRFPLDREPVGRVQEFLTEFGEIMVERKLLFP